MADVYVPLRVYDHYDLSWDGYKLDEPVAILYTDVIDWILENLGYDARVAFVSTPDISDWCAIFKTESDAIQFKLAW